MTPKQEKLVALAAEILDYGITLETLEKLEEVFELEGLNIDRIFLTQISGNWYIEDADKWFEIMNVEAMEE